MKDEVKDNLKGHYLMPDGTLADPDSFEKGEDGVLKNKNGMSPAKGPDGQPETFEKYSEGTMNAQAAEMGKTDEDKSQPKSDEFKFAKPPEPIHHDSDGNVVTTQTGQAPKSPSQPPASQQKDNVVRQPAPAPAPAAPTSNHP